MLGVDDASDDEQLNYANFGGVIKEALRERFPGVDDRQQQRQLYALVSSGASYNLRDELKADPSLLGGTRNLWLLADDDVDLYLKTSEKKRPEARLGDQQKQWIEDLEAAGDTEKRFNASFFSHGDSREPELAGIGSAIVGSFFTMLVTLCLSFPIGVAAAIYLEEFAPRNKFTDFIEVNINNLAAVPSIIFGLLGLAIFINLFGVAPFGAAAGRSGADADDAADPSLSPAAPRSRPCRPQCAKGPWPWRVEDAGGAAPCAAAGAAGHADRLDHRHGPGTG